MLRNLEGQMKACNLLPPDDAYRALKKIQAGMFRIGFNLWEIFKDLDPERTGNVSVTKFLSVINGPLRALVGLSEEEIGSVLRMFKRSDGFVSYDQFCQLIHDYKPLPVTEKEFEVENALRVNENLTPSEEKNLYQALTNIALKVTRNNLIIKPFFQDYEMIKKNNGVVTNTTFNKVLAFMGVHFPRDIVDLLIKRYAKDRYSVKYNAFLKELDEVLTFLERNNYVDASGKLWDGTEVPLFERAAPTGEEFGLKQVFLRNWKYKFNVPPNEVVNIFTKIRDHMCRNKVRVEDYFKICDPKCTDRVNVEEFLMALRWLSQGRVDSTNLYLTPKEVGILLELYSDPINEDRKLWKIFKEDLEGGVDTEVLDTWPITPPFLPTKTLAEIYPVDEENLIITKPPTMEDMMYGLKLREEKYKVDYTTAFLRVDQQNTGLLRSREFLRALRGTPVILTNREYEWLCEKYMNKEGYLDWWKFVDDLNKMAPVIKQVVTSEEEKEKKKKEVEEEEKREQHRRECNVVEVLAKIKSMLRCYRAKLKDFMEPYDKEHTGRITIEEFKAALNVHDLKLTETELNTLLYVFTNPDNDKEVDYIKFLVNVDDESVRPCLVRPPLKEEMQAAAEAEASAPHEYQFLNFEERQICASAMKRLSRLISLGNLDFFRSLDKEKKDTIDRNVFMQALHHINVLHRISARELDIVMKSFGSITNNKLEIYYIDFIYAIDIIYKHQKAAELLN